MGEIKAAKHLGQHFLSEQGVIDKLIHHIAPQPNETMVEIGPGLGALTLPVLERTGTLIAIEYDHRVIEPLRIKVADKGKLTIIEADILTIQFNQLKCPLPIRVIGNLPYNLSSPILFHCLAQRHLIKDMHFMLQKEVVERITAEPGSKIYGRLSLMLQQYLHTENLFTIGPHAFRPPPKVESAVVRLIPRAQPAWHVTHPATFELLIRAAFSQRRKMIRKSLANWFDSDRIAALGIEPTARPETLTGADFAILANHLSDSP